MKKSLAHRSLCLSLSLTILSALSVSVFAQQQKQPVPSKPVVIVTQAEMKDSRQQQQQQQKLITNSDIIRLVKAGFGESVVINYIQTNQSRFDVSVNALIELKNSGASQRIIETMQFIAAAGGSGRQQQQQSAQTISNQPSPSNQSISQQPPSLPSSSSPDYRGAAAESMAALPPSTFGQQFYALLIQGGDKQVLQAALTQVVQTKEKTGDLASIARDTAVTEAISRATGAAISAAGAAAVTSSVPIFGGIIQGGMMAGSLLRKKPTLTYVTAIGGQSSQFAPQTDNPKFEVVFGNVAGVNPDEYEPVIVKLIPTTNNWRLVFAKKAKQGNMMEEGKFYSDFSEERVASRATKLGRGDIRIESEKPLAAGEYAVVLRPVSQEKTYSVKNPSDSAAFPLMWAVWDFTIRNSSGAAQTSATVPISESAVSPPSATKSQAASLNSNSRNPQTDSTQAKNAQAKIISRSSNGVTIGINGSTYDRTFETALNFLKRQGNTIESTSREAGQIITQMTNSGGYHQTGRQVQITFIKENESLTMRVAVLDQKRYKALRTEAWSDARINAEESNKMADELVATLTTAIQ